MTSTVWRRAFLILSCVLALAGSAGAQAISVDLLLARIVNESDRSPFTLSADFTSRLTANMPTGRWGVTGAGTIVESRAASGEPRRRKVTLKSLDVPFVLRPFTSQIREKLIEQIEAENRASEFLPTHDAFVIDELGGGRHQIGGVRQDIVTEVMTKYGQAGLLRDATARRAIARWLYSPTQRASIVRAGGVYMFSALVDETGLVHQLTLFYDWGQLSSRRAFVTVGGRAFSKEVVSDTTTEIPGTGRVDINLVLQLTNHCLNCPVR